MGWTIQHLDSPSTNAYRYVGAALDAAANVLPREQAAALDILRKPRTDCWFQTTPQQAAAIRDALNAATRKLRWRKGRHYIGFLTEVADAADTAARSRRPWQWS